MLNNYYSNFKMILAHIEQVSIKRLLIFFTSVFLVTIALTYLVLLLTERKSDVSNDTLPVNAQDESSFIPSNEVINFLLLGHGGPGHQGGNLMDSIILLSVDAKNKKALLVSVPRDLWVEGRKVNEGFVAGSYDLLKHQVETITGIYPQYYVSIDFDSFVRTINELGGIEAKITKAYEDKLYPIRGRENDTCGKSSAEFAALHQKYSGYQLEIQFECRYETIKFDPGIVKMDGDTALKYVRSRHGDGDFGRSERQFVVLNAMLGKIISLNLLSGPALDNLLHFVETNLGLAEIKGIAGLITNPNDYQVTSIHLTDANVLQDSKGSSGQFILLPRDGQDKWGGISSYISSEYKNR